MVVLRKKISGSHWHADHELVEILDRRPVAISASLDFLRKGQLTDSSSAKELSKFNLVNMKHWNFSNTHDHEASTSSMIDRHDKIQIQFGSISPPPQQSGISALPIDRLALMEHYLSQAESEAARVIECISFGQFKCPVRAQYPPLPQCFLKSAFRYAPPHDMWPPMLSAKHKADLAQADYSADDINSLATNWAALCARCLQWGHTRIDFHAHLICINYSGSDHKTGNCPKRCNHDNRHLPESNKETAITVSRFLGNPFSTQTMTKTQRNTVRCDACGFYGHVARSCQ